MDSAQQPVIKKVIWLKVASIAIVEALCGLISFYTYLFISWLFFGEGASSFFYTAGNEFFLALSPLFLPSLFNGIQMRIGYNRKDRVRLKTYLYIEIVVFALYLAFICWYGCTNGFHI